MTEAQILLLFNLGSAVFDNVAKLKLAVDKISAMSDEECDRYNQDQNLISDQLMTELDTI